MCGCVCVCKRTNRQKERQTVFEWPLSLQNVAEPLVQTKASKARVDCWERTAKVNTEYLFGCACVSWCTPVPVLAITRREHERLSVLKCLCMSLLKGVETKVFRFFFSGPGAFNPTQRVPPPCPPPTPPVTFILCACNQSAVSMGGSSSEVDVGSSVWLESGPPVTHNSRS